MVVGQPPPQPAPPPGSGRCPCTPSHSQCPRAPWLPLRHAVTAPSSPLPRCPTHAQPCSRASPHAPLPFPTPQALCPLPLSRPRLPFALASCLAPLSLPGFPYPPRALCCRRPAFCREPVFVSLASPCLLPSRLPVWPLLPAPVPGWALAAAAAVHLLLGVLPTVSWRGFASLGAPRPLPSFSAAFFCHGRCLPVWTLLPALVPGPAVPLHSW